MYFKPSLGIAFGLCFVACSETTPNQYQNKNQPSNYVRTVHPGPILVSVDELEKEDYSEVLLVKSGTAILLNDNSADYDSAVTKRNRSLNTRNDGTVSIKASGESLLTQRTDYDTATGEVTTYRHYEYDPATNMRIKRTRFNAPGADTIWFNEDDVVQDYSTYHVLMGTTQTLSIHFIGAGPDATWFTEDDEVDNYVTELHAADGTPIGEILHNGPGADALWFTEDDDIQSVTEDIIAADGSEHWVMFTDAGADADWTTLEDNTVGNFASTLFNADSLETRHIFYNDVGADLTPFTEDDIPLYYHTFTHNAANLESNKLRYNGPGVDTIWLTADDNIEECEETTFTVDDLIEQEVDTHVGTDNLCFTGDDTIVDYNSYTHDATGHLTDEHRFTDPGPDLHWHTEDDLLSREYIFTPI
ncbi:MAG: hypothetical protein OEX07_04995 [Gammaproteobacteria bacterium]|nr:hypothetical protein [Gammaproteobacteria bacterium]